MENGNVCISSMGAILTHWHETFKLSMFFRIDMEFWVCYEGNKGKCYTAVDALMHVSATILR